MRNELSDTLLSAYLDGELTGEERAAVEARLRESAEHRQALAELQQLRESFQAMPRYELGDDFADRVVDAALAAAAQQSTANEPARVPLAPSTVPADRTPASRTPRWLYAVGAIAAVAACWLVFVQFGGGPTPQPVVDRPNDVRPADGGDADEGATQQSPAFAVLRESLPGEGEALVIRVRVPAGTKPADALDAALAQTGIRQLTPSEPTSAGRIGAAYRTAVREKLSVAGEDKATANSASDALYVEAPLGLIEDALAVLAEQEGGKLELKPEMKVAVATTGANGSNGAEAEGESTDGSNGASASNEPFAQRLNSRIFKLPPVDGAAAAETGSHEVDANRKVRVLILVETAK